MERFFRSLKTQRQNHLSFMNHGFVVQVIEQYIYFTIINGYFEITALVKIGDFSSKKEYINL